MKRVLAILALVLAMAASSIPASAQEGGEEPPWFVMTLRPAFGSGSGSMNMEWEAYGGTLNLEDELTLGGVGHAALIPEAFFMPTAKRGFTITASLPFGGGSGKVDSDVVFEDNDFAYRFFFLNLGLGYQFYFGPEKRANLALLSHVGGGRTQFQVEDANGETATSKALGAWDFDLSIGSWYRFPSNFVLGGSLDYWVMGFSGEAGESDDGVVDATVTSGGVGIMRLNGVIGWAFQ